VHLLRNSFRYAGRQHYEAIAKALRPVYTAPTEAAAMERFLEFCEAWGERYPAIVRLWENAWAEFVPFLSFDVEIRKIVCTTNAIWVFGSWGRLGRCFPGRCVKRPALTLNAIDAVRLSSIRSVGLAA
jgi:putative transposase